MLERNVSKSVSLFGFGTSLVAALRSPCKSYIFCRKHSLNTKPIIVWEVVLALFNGLLQLGSPLGSQVLPESRGVLHVLRADICSAMILHGLSRDKLHHHGLPHGLERNLFQHLEHLLSLFLH